MKHILFLLIFIFVPFNMYSMLLKGRSIAMRSCGKISLRNRISQPFSKVLAPKKVLLETVCKDGVCSIVRNNKKAEPFLQALPSVDVTLLEITDENFETVLKESDKPVIIDFYATWCQPCKLMKPIYKALSKENNNWIFCVTDIDASPKVKEACAISAMPTFIVFKEGIKWGVTKGLKSKESLQEELHKIISSEIPMGSNKAEITEQLITFIAASNVDQIKKMIHDGANLNNGLVKFQDIIYPLSMAINFGNRDVVNLLMQHGALYTQEIEKIGKKQLKDTEISIQLLQENINYVKAYCFEPLVPNNAPTERDTSDLLMRFMKGMRDSALLEDILKEKGLVNTVFSFGKSENTPLGLALILNNKEAITLLLQAGARIDVLVNYENNKKVTIENAIESYLELLKIQLSKTQDLLHYTIELSKKNG